LKSAIKEWIYRVLLSSPHEVWTVRTLTTAAASDIRTSSVRDTVYMLIAAGAMTVVPGNQAITVRLSAAGLTRLQSIVKPWRSRYATRTPNQATATVQHRSALASDE
jgi:hypothetical protein